HAAYQTAQCRSRAPAERTRRAVRFGAPARPSPGYGHVPTRRRRVASGFREPCMGRQSCRRYLGTVGRHLSKNRNRWTHRIKTRLMAEDSERPPPCAPALARAREIIEECRLGSVALPARPTMSRSFVIIDLGAGLDRAA